MKTMSLPLLRRAAVQIGVAIAVVAALIGGSVSVSQAAEVNVIPDPGLRQCLDDTMQSYVTGYKSDVQSISQADLDALAQATTSTYSLFCSGVGSLSGLQNLHDSELYNLRLYNSTVTDFSILAAIPSIFLLEFENASFTTIPASISKLTTITDLEFSGSQINDLTSLKDMTWLLWLWLGENQVSDVTPLKNLTNLNGLDLSHNRISDVSPLKNLTNLNSLSLGDNQISDVSPLKNLTKLEGLSLWENQINDVAPLANMTNLTQLSLGDNQISDVTPLKNLTNLDWLDLNDNRISDVSPLKNMTKLDALSLGDNQISDVAPLANMTNLTQLSLSDNQISDVTPLKNLTKLTDLYLRINKISDVSALKNLTNLTNLELGDNQISDVSALKNLTKLEYLTLAENHITDLSPLSKIPLLENSDQVYGLAGQTLTSSAKSGSTVSLPSVKTISRDDPISWSVLQGKATINASKGTVTYNSPGEIILQWWGAKYISGGTMTVSTCQNFTDVPSSNTFASSICWASYTGITKGTGDGTTYSPSNPVNRGSMAAFLYRLAGSPKWDPPTTSPFVDVKTTDTFYSSITWLYNQKVTVGTMINGKLYYQPNNAVNRGSMAAFLYRLSGSPKWSDPTASPFTDLAKSNTFYHSITWLADQKITVGTMVNGKLVYQPGNSVNRGSMAAFMSRLSKTQLQCTKYEAAVGC